MKKLSPIFIILLVSIFVLTACGSKDEQTKVETVPELPSLLIAEGRLLPVNSMDQSFSVPGQVSEVLVKDGESVKAGQALARLAGSPELQLALARAHQEALAAQQALDALKAAAQVNLTQGRLAVILAEKQVEIAQDEYDADGSEENKAKVEAAEAALKMAEDNQAQLEKDNGVDSEQLAAIDARLATATAALTSAQEAVDALTLKSTLDGVVVDLALQVGQRVIPGQPVITVADFSSWIVMTDNLKETEIVNITIGQKAEIILDALPGVTLSGEVTRINTRHEEKRGDITYTVTLALTQTDPLMRWGMTAAVQFIP